MTDTTTTPPSQDVEASGVAPITRHVGLALLALAIGGFAIGTTEFVTMGLLPQVAKGIGTDIPTAGRFVSAYALGVVVGAPLIAVLAAKVPRKAVLLALIVGFAVANVASGFPTTYGQLMGARFLSGMPHGAFFGIGSVVAASLVSKERRTWAVAMMLIGLGVANVVGVPLTTLLGQDLGWQVPYRVVGIVGVVTVLATWAWVPDEPASGEESMLGELRALGRLQVWLALIIGTVGFGGMFATYAYIAPTMTDLAGVLHLVRPGRPRHLRRRDGRRHGRVRKGRPPGRHARDRPAPPPRHRLRARAGAYGRAMVASASQSPQ